MRCAYGHRRLLEIARALASRPRLLLLDEPAAGLVAEEIRALAALIRRLKASGMTVLLIEHHIELVTQRFRSRNCARLWRVIAEGAPAAIQRDERVIAAYLGAPMPLLEVADLHVGYGELEVVQRHLIERSRPGEIVTVLGSNGAGKTTTLRCLAGLLRRPRADRVWQQRHCRRCRRMPSPSLGSRSSPKAAHSSRSTRCGRIWSSAPIGTCAAASAPNSSKASQKSSSCSRAWVNGWASQPAS